MHKLTHPNGSVLFIQRPREVQAFIQAQPFEPQAPGLPRQLVLLMAGLLVIMALLAASAFAMSWLAEKADQPGDVQPTTTMPPPHQPASNLPWQQ